MKKNKKILKKQLFTSKVLSFRFYVLGGKKKIDSNAFTLVELIIVIAIIAVLAVAAFMMLTKWLGKSRDSRRLGDMATIKKALEVTYSDTDNGVNMYPSPTDEVDVLDGSGTVMWNQGVFGLGTIANMDNMQKAPQDPSDQTYYKYAVTLDKKEFQLGTVLEDGSNVSVVGSVLAANGKAKLDGNYDGYVSYPTTGGTMIFKTPSLLIKGEAKIEIFSGAVDNFMLDGEEAGAEFELRSVKTDEDSSAEEVAIALGIDEKSAAVVLKNETGAVVTVVANGEPQVDAGELPGSCVAQPDYNNATFEENSPTEANTAWQSNESADPCYYSCDSGYIFRNGDCQYDIENSGQLVLYHDYDYSYDEDFTTLDTSNKWRDISKEGTCTIVDNKINVYYSGTTERASCRYRGKKFLRGDFDIEIEYSNFNLLQPNNSANGLVFGVGGSGLRSYISRQYSTSGYNLYTTRNSDVASVTTSDTSGKLRLTRTGITTTGYYWDNSTNLWVSNGNSTLWNYGGDAVIDIHFQKAGTLDQTISGTLDNFIVHKGEIMEDISGNGNDGVGAYITGNAGKKANALEFDGVKGYVAVPDSDDFTFGTEDFTIDYWMKPTGLPNTYPRVFDKVDTNNYATDRFLMNISDSNGQKRTFFGVQINNVWEVSLSTDIDFNQWTHIAVVRYGDTWTLYKNGVNVANLTKNVTVPDFDGEFIIGDDYFRNGTRTFQGYIDEFRIVKGKAVWTDDFDPEDY